MPRVARYVARPWRGEAAQGIPPTLTLQGSEPSVEYLMILFLLALAQGMVLHHAETAATSSPVLRSLGSSLLDTGPVALASDGLHANQEEHRHPARVAPQYLPEEGRTERSLSEASPPGHDGAGRSKSWCSRPVGEA